MLTLSVSVISVVAFAVIIIGSILLIPIFKNKWWIPAVIGALATLAFGLIFHTWWFLLLAFLLAALTTTAFFVSSGWRIILAITIVLVTIGAIFVIVPRASGELNKYRSSIDDMGEIIASKINSTNINEASPANPIIPVVATDCVEAVIVESQTHGGLVEADLNDGDPFDYGLTVVNPDVPQGNQTLVVLTEPRGVFDVIYPKMYFTSYRLRGTLDEAICSALKLAPSAKNYVFVGEAAMPKGWTSVDITGWWTELVKKEYADEPIINTGSDEWPAYQLAPDDPNRTIDMDSAIYGQLWNPNIGGVVYHFQIEKGYKLTVGKWIQGTYWGIPDGATNVQERIIQATNEVVLRDNLNPANVTLIYCGDSLPKTLLEKEGYVTVSWRAQYYGWKCEMK
ncbi:MAG TPA: hypothetical protein VLH94_03380 [Spirochaetia bacterium]|nr:hypothetical protein [Spirochaetia bacterium]